MSGFVMFCLLGVFVCFGLLFFVVFYFVGCFVVDLCVYVVVCLFVFCLFLGGFFCVLFGGDCLFVCWFLFCFVSFVC